MPKIEKGNILISEPYITDDNFFRSVILIADYDEETGAVGFMLNQATDTTLYDIMEEEGFPTIPLFEGGPVQMDSLFFIHSSPILDQDSLEITDKLFWGGNFEDIAPLLKNGSIKEEEIKFFIGYSGWAPGQLEEELQMGSWFISDINYKNILEESGEDLWKYSVGNLKSNDKIWANAPLNPLLN